MPKYCDDNYDDFEGMEEYERKRMAFEEDRQLKNYGEQDGFGKSLSSLWLQPLIYADGIHLIALY